MKRHYDNPWISFHPKFSHFRFVVGPASYFDNRWYISCFLTQLISIAAIITSYMMGLGNASLLFLLLFLIPWGNLNFHLPITSKWDDCDPPEYGIAYHSNKIWIYRGGEGNLNGGNKWWTITMPWDYDWVRTSRLKSTAIEPNPDGPSNSQLNYAFWIHESKGNRLDTWKDEFKSQLWSRDYPYVYRLKSGKIQERIATVKVEEREWRMRWLRWTTRFNKVRRDIAIDFNDEVGERTGSWKGGCTGCGYNLNPGETPLECLRRMEKERKF